MDVVNDMHTLHHTESLRRKSSYYWPGRHEYSYLRWPPYPLNDFRPALNVRALISMLSPTSDEDISLGGEPLTNGRILRKRKAPKSDSGPSKRVRLDQGYHNVREGGGEDDDDDNDNDARYRQTYPAFWDPPCDVINDVDGDKATRFLQVYQFGMNLRYNNAVDDDSDDYADDEDATRWGWCKEEEKLRTLLEERQKDVSLSRDIDMGRFYMTRYHGHLVAFSKHEGAFSRTAKMVKKRSDGWLCLLPDLPWPDGADNVELEGHDIQPSGVHLDFITACALLQSYDRVKLEARLQLHILSEGTYDPEYDLPFELRAHFVLSLAMPEQSDGSHFRGEVNGLDGLQHRLFCFLSNTPFTPPVPGIGGEVTNVTIPFFLNIMRPAPPLPEHMTYESLQPEGLLLALMPFQRRTVAWMLEREHKQITPEGTVVTLDAVASSSAAGRRLPPFWEEIEMGDQTFFFNRLTSALSLTLPEPHAALGGILAEEPGLGKTMECLSLILLNPAPERNPVNKRWDPEAQVHVKEIKTTLIVTPPALASQWADEFAAHAPDLKVFVYEGWAKVKVPITAADVKAEVAKRRPAAPKAPPKSKLSAKRCGKARSNGVEDEDVVMDDGDMNPNDIMDWASYINQFDVCITTYKVLQTDRLVARAPPERSRREGVEYKNVRRPRSPLVVCEWYRVIMDEVQMMGAGKSEEMVSLIPRLSSFAVSGTPARAQVSDLIGVLRFLRIDDLVAPKRLWNRLLRPGFKDQFASLFQRYSVRTLKSGVENELTIPQQQRYLVSIELGRVERHVYDQALEQALAELGLDARGVAAYEGWEVDASVLRNVLRRLRGICTHPQVGQLQKQGDRLNKSGALKSIADVLESMIEQNWRNLMEDRKGKVLTLTRLAQLQQHRADERDRYQRALEALLTAETEANQLIDEIKASAAQHNVKGEVLKKEARALRDSRNAKLSSDKNSDGIDKGKRRQLERDSTSPIDLDLDSDEDEDAEDRGLPKTPAGEEHRAKRMALSSRLRECYLVLHRVKFLQGDVYHVLGSSFAEKEDTAYAGAEVLRKDLLKSTEEAANGAMRRLSAEATEKRVTQGALQIPLPFMKGGGIRSTHLFEEANEIIEEVLNEQSALLWRWRAKIVELLSQKLNAAGEQADGEEYARTLDTQGEAEVYLQAYTALLADRRETIAAERTLLAAHEGREKKTRKTKAAARAKMRAEENLEIPEDLEVQPEHEVLHKQLLEERKELQLSDRALKSVMVDLSTIAVSIPRENDPEKMIAKEGAARLRTLISNLQELTDKLDADLAVLRKVFNDRIVYFRHLQEISDTVVEVRWEGTLPDAMESTRLDIADFAAKINTKRARQRYLEHLATGGSYVDDDDVGCILCQCEFSRGFITQCAHIFCEDCMKAWIARGQGRACPVCRSPIDHRELQRFSIQEERPPPPKPVTSNGELVPVSRREIQYNMIDPVLFADIQTMESNGSYGSKIQALVRHLLHIQLVDPGAKSIVFSAWADSLSIVEHALHSNGKFKVVSTPVRRTKTLVGIPSMRLDRGSVKSGAKRFRVDPALQVLLLHGERDNAGLNVTCASRVFLLESVVNHGFEVQAIARIDRLGQTRATEVFCYYAEDTVEKNILDLAARQGLSLYTKANSAGTLNVTSLAMDADKTLVDAPTKPGQKGRAAQKGDFIFRVNDMLAILFPHMFEELEYLLPQDDDGDAGASDAEAPPVPARRVYVNAEAGPSRLPS